VHGLLTHVCPMHAKNKVSFLHREARKKPPGAKAPGSNSADTDRFKLELLAHKRACSSWAVCVRRVSHRFPQLPLVFCSGERAALGGVSARTQFSKRPVLAEKLDIGRESKKKKWSYCADIAFAGVHPYLPLLIIQESVLKNKQLSADIYSQEQVFLHFIRPHYIFP